MSSCYESNCYGCGRPSDTPVCYLCTCKQCGNILIHGTCLNCNSGTGNSFTYDPIPESLNEVQISPNPPPQCHFNIYLCQICESNSHYGYECSQRVLLVYEPEPCYIQNFSDNDYSHDLPGVDPLIDHRCCYECGVDPLIDHHCCYECGNSLNDFFCPHCTCEFCGNGAHVGYNCPSQVPSFQTFLSFRQQYPCCEDCGGLPEADHCQPPQYTVNHPIFNAHNDLLNSRPTLIEQMEQLTSMCEMACQIIQKKKEERQIKEEQVANARYWKILACCDDDGSYNSAITPNEPVDSLSMGDEHLDTVSATESDEFIKSSDYEFDSVDDHSCFDEDVPEKIFSNPLFEEKIIPMKIDQHHFNAESDLIESMLNHDSSIIPFSSKIDSLLDEFASELTLLKSISPRIDKTNCYNEDEIRITKRLLYDNSSPRPPEEFVSNNSDAADIESFSPSPILVEDSNSFMEEIDLFLKLDDPMPPGIEEDDYGSKRDILIHGNTGILNIKMMGDNSEQKVPIFGPTITRVPNQEKSPDLLSHRGFETFQPFNECPMMIHGKNIPVLDVPLFHFYPIDQLKYGGNWVKLSDLKQALRGRHPMLISSLVFLFNS
nr:hypothetical protein [Tanacetum cinerariifolium]